MSIHVSAQRAAAGAVMLDSILPGWEEKIDRSRLDLGSELDCVFAQLFGHYGRVPEQYKTRAVENGFYSSAMCKFGEPQHPEVREEYRMLTMAWRAEIGSRLHKGAAPVESSRQYELELV